MSASPEEVITTEVESGLSAPANVISEDALDCGCKQLQCPKLAKYATRSVYVTIICLIGALQAAAHAYIIITSSSVSRKFFIDHVTMDWVLGIFHITTFTGGLAVAYWGDRIHRASWTGALVLLQSTCFLMFLIPQFTHPNRTIEEPIDSNTTHLSMYAEDSPEICIREGSAKIIAGEADTCYFTLFIFAIAQFLSGLANVSYFALGVSYLDDNTKRKNVASYIGLIVAMKILGLLFGSLLAWSFLKIDADNFNLVESYREQIGAWWLGWPILAVLLAIPALLLAIFPRRLVSEVIEQAADKILNESGNIERYNVPVKKVGSTFFLPSLLRILKNKILIFNVVSTAFCAMAIYNFVLKENIFLEARFYVPRPNGLLLGFNDPITSRSVTNTLKPLIIGFAVIISGLVIAKTKPKAISLVGYNFVVILATSIIIFGLAFNDCNKRPIVGDKYNIFALVNYCNHDCRCTKDADFRPVCDNNGKFTFYSACYAGCSVTNVLQGIRSYDECTCVEDLTGKGNLKATEGSCESSNCQTGWIIFEIVTIMAYSLIASSIVGDFLVNLRSAYVQDKALTIAFWMTWMAFFIQIPGKLIYDAFGDTTCKFWGLDKHMCRLHSDTFGNYLCFATAAFLLIGAIFKAAVCYFCKDLKLYEINKEEPEQEEQEAMQVQPLLQPEAETTGQNISETARHDNEPSTSEAPVPEEPQVKKVNQVRSASLKHAESESSKNVSYAKDLRPNSLYVSLSKNKNKVEDLNASSDESNVFSESTESKISYKPLELDSDTGNDLYNYGPKSRQRIPSKSDKTQSIQKQKTFPNPDDYEDPRKARGYKTMINDGESSLKQESKISKSSELTKSQGDFNEIGIPVVSNYESEYSKSKMFDKSHDSIVGYQFESKINNLDCSKLFMRSLDEMRILSDIEKTHYDLTEKLVRPPSRDQESSGFGSLQNISDSTPRQSLRRRNSKESLSSKTSTSTTGSHSKSSAITTDL